MKKQIRKITRIPMLTALLCVVLLVSCIFLPYVTAEPEYVELLEAMEQDTSVSLYDFGQIYLEENETALMKVVAILGVFCVMSALCALFRTPILVMVFDILATAVFVLNYLIYSDSIRGYVLGIASWLSFVAGAGLFVSAIWMLVAINKTKKNAQTRTSVPEYEAQQ